MYTYIQVVLSTQVETAGRGKKLAPEQLVHGSVVSLDLIIHMYVHTL